MKTALAVLAGMAVIAAATVAAIWIGLTISCAAGDIPPGFAIPSVTTGGYAAVALRDRLAGRGAEARQ